jgi:hypothetical protein
MGMSILIYAFLIYAQLSLKQLRRTKSSWCPLLKDIHKTKKEKVSALW